MGLWPVGKSEQRGLGLLLAHFVHLGNFASLRFNKPTTTKPSPALSPPYSLPATHYSLLATSPSSPGPCALNPATVNKTQKTRATRRLDRGEKIMTGGKQRFRVSQAGHAVLRAAAFRGRRSLRSQAPTDFDRQWPGDETKSRR